MNILKEVAIPSTDFNFILKYFIDFYYVWKIALKQYI